MIGIVKKIDAQGFGIIDGADGSKIPFIRADIRNRNMLEPGESVVFSLRMVKDKAFAQNITAMPPLRTRLRKMSDQELLRFGQAAKFMCLPEANFGKPPRQVFVIQLEEAREEWKRRNPGLPLSESI
jgi:cold shock CspA family protein